MGCAQCGGWGSAWQRQPGGWAPWLTIYLSMIHATDTTVQVHCVLDLSSEALRMHLSTWSEFALEQLMPLLGRPKECQGRPAVSCASRAIPSALRAFVRTTAATERVVTYFHPGMLVTDVGRLRGSTEAAVATVPPLEIWGTWKALARSTF